MVAASLDRSRTEDVVELSTVRLLVNPFSDSVEHVAVKLAVFVTNSWVVESAENISHNLVDGDSWVFPCVQNTRRNILQDCCCNTTGNSIQFVGEMVLGEHGMCRIGAVGIIPRLELRVGTIAS